MILKDKIKLLPNKPGCYLMKNEDNIIIYVGKAKNLKNRVNSYFVGSHNTKTTALISNIVDFDYVITNTELDALLLEINLIKEHDPKYNIMFTDDKTYPYICISNEKIPRLYISRSTKSLSGNKFGPYPNVKAAGYTHRLLSKLFPLRKCRVIPKKECLYYHIKQCVGPCIKKIDNSVYQDMKQDIIKFLKGNTKDVLYKLHQDMLDASKVLNYERAQELKETIESIKKTTEKQNIVINDLTNKDVYSYFVDEDYISIQCLYMREGSIVATDSKTLYYYNDHEDFFRDYIIKQYKVKKLPLPKEIILITEDNKLIEDALDVKVITPKKGDKKKILDLATKNAKENIDHNKEILKRKEDNTINAVEDLASLLNISKASYIEAFDNSNILGDYAVSGMVVYKNGTRSPKDYRKFKINTVTGPDDYASMKEVIYRRYFKVLIDNLKKPDLIIVDGAKGQVSAAKEILDSLNLDIPLIGLKKDDKHKTKSIITSELEEIGLKKNSNIFRLLYNIQEEVHRYALNYHKKVRSRSIISSKLDEIKGVGDKTKQLLLTNFDSIDDIKSRTYKELVNIGINERVSKQIINHLKDNNS